MSSDTKGTQDEDCLFLEQVLDKLYDLGDASASRKKLKSQKRKKRPRSDGEEDGVPTDGDVCSDTKDCRADYDSAPEHQQQQQQQPEPRGPTLPVNQVEVVRFQDPRKKPKTKQTPTLDKVPAIQVTEKKQNDRLDEPNLEKARLEVHRFGITGYKKEEQRVFEQDRAIMLGAKPPKKSYVNYKVLQAQIKEKKRKSKEVHMDSKKKKKTGNSERDKKKKVSSGSGSAPSGHLGHFKGGMLVLSSKEIQMIKGNK
ncbi:uncharacterized protein C1orf131 homolog [Betta splendens]|uniref:Uncharacterized protein C1orf131 homolog n=1 Tax=Betta splendens TaxID=158456 RepID=A0A6P7LPZ4_BETSP|nr:uncharacterized protein C1orf131 homolog [Betta splendens]